MICCGPHVWRVFSSDAQMKGDVQSQIRTPGWLVVFALCPDACTEVAAAQSEPIIGCTNTETGPLLGLCTPKAVLSKQQKLPQPTRI